MFIEYKETGYKGYLQPYYTLEQASKELNTIIGYEVYNPEKLMQLSLVYDFNLYYLTTTDDFIFSFNIDSELIENYSLPERYQGFKSTKEKDTEIMNEELNYLLHEYLTMNNYGDFILISLGHFVTDIILRDMGTVIDDMYAYYDIFSNTVLYTNDCYKPNGQLPSKVVKALIENERNFLSQFKKYEINIVYREKETYNDTTIDNKILELAFNTEPIKPPSIALKDLKIIAYDLERILNNTLLPKEIDIKVHKSNKPQQIAKTQRGETGLLATIGLLTELLLDCKKENGRAIYGNKQALLNTIAEMNIPTQSKENIDKRLRHAEKALNEVKKIKINNSPQ